MALAPRTDYICLKTYRKFAAVDDQPAWLISCFYVRSKYRRQGLMEKLTAAACEHASSKGARLIEAIPISANEKRSPLSIYTGVESVFQRLGFEVAAVREDRSIFRKSL